jgi:tetratricopeptide (TPR) repeat protein
MSRPHESLAYFAWRALPIDATLASVLFADLVAKLPTDARHHAGYGAALARTGQHQAALAAFERSVSLDPNAIESWCNLGEVALELLEWRRAIFALGRCLDLDPDAKHPSGLRARALIKRTEKTLSA